jgi:hypothetical protein
VKNGTLAAPSGAKFPQIATISFQAIKAAIANPVKSLRSESEFTELLNFQDAKNSVNF